MKTERNGILERCWASLKAYLKSYRFFSLLLFFVVILFGVGVCEFCCSLSEFELTLSPELYSDVFSYGACCMALGYLIFWFGFCFTKIGSFLDEKKKSDPSVEPEQNKEL